MKVSVIVPTYKPQAYLWECLDSIYNQTFPKTDYELVLVLNGCCEPYNTQIKEWLSQHSDLQVQYIQTDEGGVSNARNIALDKARGEYVTFIDDDDLVSPSYLEELYCCASPSVVSLCYPYAFKDGKKNVQLPYAKTEIFNYCVEYNKMDLQSMVRKFFSGPCMKLIPMSFIQNRRFDVRFKNGEDSLFMFLISDKIRNVAFTSKEAIYYRRFREGSALTRKHTRNDIISNQIKMMVEYSRVYWNSFGHYSFYFYVTRLLGAIKGMGYFLKFSH